ncbi:MAG: autotransporter domain-containing protein, partial [Gammaproteobacteria bacterium]
IVANSSGNGTAIIGDGGSGVLALDSGASFLIDGIGSSTARLVVGSRTGDDIGDGLVLVGGGTSALTVQSTGTTARLDIGACASSFCTGTGFARGEMSVVGGAIATIAGIGQAAEVRLASDTNTEGLLLLGGGGSQMDIRGTSARLLIGGPGATGGGEAGAAAIVSVVDGAILNVGATGTSSGVIEVGKGTNGGTLSVTGSTVNVAGDINVASSPTTGVNGAGTLAINGGSRVTATGTTRLFAGSTLTGFPQCDDICLDDGVLNTRFLELYAGAQIIDDHLEIVGVEEFRAFAGATFTTSFDALIGGPSIQRVTATDALLDLGGDVGIGAISGSNGTASISGADGQLNINGRLGVGINGGTGTLNLNSGAFASVAGQTGGPTVAASIINPSAVIGSGGRVNVADTGTIMQVFGGVDVDGGRIDVTAGGELITGLAAVGSGGTINASAATLSIGDDLSVGAGTGNSGSIQIGSGSLLRVFGDLEIGTNGGTGSLVLSGESSAELSTGEIAVDLLLGSGGRVEVLQGSSLDLSGDIGLGGGLLNIGTGSDVFADRLTMGSGGRVTGSGRLNLTNGVLAGAGSTVSPGNSPGLLTVNGDLTIDGGTLLIELGGSNPGEFDVLRVEGDFAFNSGAFNLSLLNDFVPVEGTEFRVIEARDSLTVNTQNVTFGYVGMGPDYQFSIRDFDLSNGSVSQTYRGGFVSFVARDIAPLPGLTGNEQSLAVALDELCPQVEGITDPTADEQDLDRICGGLRSSQNSEEQVQDALDALAPEEITGAVNSLLRYTTVQHGNLSQRINGLRYGVKPIDFGGLNLQFDEHMIAGKDLERFLTDLVGGAASADEDFARWGFFGNGSFSKGDKDATVNESGFGFDGAVLTLGTDYRLRDNLFVGGAFGFNDLTADFDTGGGLDFQSMSGSLFGTWLYQDAGYVDALVTWGSSETETRRRVVYDDAIGSVDRTAEGDTEGTVVLASLSGGWDFERQALVYGPHIGLNFTESQVDGFDETGADGANLSIPNQETRSLTANLGVHASYTLTPSFGVLIPHVRLDWVREFEDDAETINVRFLSDRFSEDPTNPTSPFAVRTDAPDADYLSWSVGASAQFINGVAAFVNYRGNALQNDTQIGELTLGIRMEKSF